MDFRMLQKGEEAIMSKEYQNGIDLLETELNRQPRLSLLHASVHSLLGQAYFCQKKYSIALEHHKLDLAISKRSSQLSDIIRASSNISLVCAVQNNFEDSVACARSIDVIAESVHDENCKKLLQCRVSYLLGMANMEHSLRQICSEDNQAVMSPDRSHYASAEFLQEAVSHFKTQLDIARDMQDDSWEQLAIGNLGNALYYLGEHSKAIDFLQNRLIIAQNDPDEADQLKTLKNMANCYTQLADSYDLTSSERSKNDRLAIRCYKMALGVKEKAEKAAFMKTPKPRKATEHDEVSYVPANKAMFGSGNNSFGDPKSRRNTMALSSHPHRFLSKIDESEPTDEEQFKQADPKILDRHTRRQSLLNRAISAVKRLSMGGR